MKENWDKFESNIAEMLGPIEKKAFNFSYKRYQVWKGGICIDEGTYNSQIIGVIAFDEIKVSLVKNTLTNYITNEFNFSQISTNDDRVMWSKDIFNSTGEFEFTNPDIMSLFFINEELKKISFTIYNPGVLVEFYSY